MSARNSTRVAFLQLFLLTCYNGGISTVSAFFLVKSHHQQPFGRDQVILGPRKLAVEKLDPVSGKVIQSFDSTSEASRQTGIPASSISSAINGKVRHAGNFLWRREGDQSRPHLFESTEAILELRKREGKPVEQLDPVTGGVIRSFDSIREASRKTDIPDEGIRSALNGTYRHAGKFLWRRKGDKAIPTLFEGTPNTNSRKQVPVEQIDPVTGEVLQSFKSIAEASRQTGIETSSIRNAVNGKYRHGGAYLWRRQGDQSTADLFDSPPTSNNKPVPIEQLDPVTGEIIQSFKTITEAERQTGIGGGGISNVLNGKQRHAGAYLWRRQGDPTTPELFESPPTRRSISQAVPIEQLDPVSGKVIRSFESVKEASRETGIFNSNISAALNGQQLHAGAYVWRRKYEKTAPKLFDSPSKPEKGRPTVPVEQLDPYSGSVIQRYESIEEASQQSRIPSMDIHQVLSGKRRHAGLFLWKRQDDETSPLLFERILANSKPLSVEQLDPLTGKVIQRFESLSEASRQTGVAKISIAKVVNGQQRRAGTYLWRRKGD